MKKTKRRKAIEFVFTNFLPLYIDLSIERGRAKMMNVYDIRWNKAKLIRKCNDS